MTDAKTISFDGWTLDPRSGELARDGKTRRLAPQPLAMLCELLAHAGEVVTRERMVQVLWPKGIVDFDNSLNAVVRKLRVTLGDDPDAPRYIETLPRIGYRFVGKLANAASAAARSPTPPPPKTRHRVAVWLAGALVTLGGLWWVGSREVTPPPSIGGSGAAEPRRTTNERAYDLYLQGIFNRSRRDLDGSDLAIENFAAALREDPYYAEAWAALAETWAGAAMTLQKPVAEAYEHARSAALRAIELDDSLGHGYAALAHVYMQFDRDFAKADAELVRAQAQDLRYARGWHLAAILRSFQGRLPEAFDAMRRARELEPMTLLYATNYGTLLYQARRYDEAIEHVKPLLASQPRLDQARSILIRALVAKGDAQSALEQLPLRVSDRPSVSDAGLVYAHLGRRADAAAEIDRIERLGAQGYGVGYDVAVIAAALGDTQAACAALERALGDHSLTLPWLRLDSRMDPVREAPCFAAVAKRVFGE